MNDGLLRLVIHHPFELVEQRIARWPYQWVEPGRTTVRLDATACDRPEENRYRHIESDTWVAHGDLADAQSEEGMNIEGDRGRAASLARSGDRATDGEERRTRAAGRDRDVPTTDRSQCLPVSESVVEGDPDRVACWRRGLGRYTQGGCGDVNRQDRH